jgi:hypothetical protein
MKESFMFIRKLDQKLIRAMIMFLVLSLIATGYIIYRAKNFPISESTLNESVSKLSEPVLTTTTFQQSFQAWKDGLHSLTLYFEPKGNVRSGKLILRLLTPNGDLLAQKSVAGKDFVNL